MGSFQWRVLKDKRPKTIFNPGLMEKKKEKKREKLISDNYTPMQLLFSDIVKKSGSDIVVGKSFE